MLISLNKLTSVVLLSSLYLLPYSLFGFVIAVFSGFIFFAKISSSDRLNIKISRAAAWICFFIFVLIISSIINSITFLDVALSVFFYGFPLLIIFLIKNYKAIDLEFLIRVNSFFIILQIPFLIYQFLSIDHGGDDWFASSMMQAQNTQIVAFVFFLNFCIYLYISKENKKNITIAIISLVCALATNTILMTFLMLVAFSLIMFMRLRTRMKLLFVLILPIIALFIFSFIKWFSSSSSKTADEVVLAFNLVMDDPENFLLIGKIRGLYFSLHHLVLNFKDFMIGLGPGSISSRLIFYKKEFSDLASSATSISGLGPLNPKFNEFTEGLFLKSNLHRPWSNISAFLLEGGILLVSAFFFLLRNIYGIMKAHTESLAILTFTFLCFFVYHAFDNIKMNAFFFISIMFFKIKHENAFQV